MKLPKNKTTATTIALFLVLTIAVTLFALPLATAQPTTKKSYAYIGALPNPVGVNQEVLLHVGVIEPLVILTDSWKGLTVTVQKPDNSTETLGPVNTDATGGTGVTYTPDMVGTYYVQTHFPAQWYNYTTFDFFSMSMVTRQTWYEAADSEKLALVVQADPIPYYPSMPLPSEYWTRPIDPQLREWYTVSGSWLTAPQNLFAPYNAAPETAHILWTKPLTTGGLAGGELGLVGSGATSVGMETGDAYEGKWTGSSGESFWTSSAIILNGKLYYQHSTIYPPVVYHCVDLHTGEELWAKTFLDNQTIDFGQDFYFQSFNSQGTFAYLWVTTGGFSFFGPPMPENWYAFDPLTGDWLYTMEDVPSGTNLYGPNGEIYRYNVDLFAGTISLWNSTEVVMKGITPPDLGSWGNNAHGQVFNASRGIQWTKPLPAGLTGSVLKTFFNDRIIGGSLNTTHVTLWGVSTKVGQEGTLLFKNTWAAPGYWAEGSLTVGGFGAGFVAWSKEDKVGVLLLKETREHYGFSLETGQYLWGPTPSEYYLNALEDTPAESRGIAYGKLYCASVSGIVYCYNVKNGTLLWKYEVNDPYTEILWANNWWQKLLFISDGKVYTGHTEHSANQPLPRGAPFVCLNATTGDVIWRANGLFRQTRWGGRAILGDSIIATMDTYDQRVYAIGKGPSKTTVSIQSDVITDGGSVVIKGTVTDISPGTEEYGLTARFPNGVPAIADESMSDYMLYVYKQFPIPGNATGVPVSLDTLDPNGNFVHIDTVTSDLSGNYGYAFTPEVPGLYTITATFAGTDSYYPSYAQTYINVEEAPPASPPIEIPQPFDYTMHFVYATIAIIIAIAIVGLLILRKK
jgi:outer membrane protein assembly factor BamB